MLFDDSVVAQLCNTPVGAAIAPKIWAKKRNAIGRGHIPLDQRREVGSVGLGRIRFWSCSVAVRCFISSNFEISDFGIRDF